MTCRKTEQKEEVKRHETYWKTILNRCHTHITNTCVCVCICVRMLHSAACQSHNNKSHFNSSFGAFTTTDAEAKLSTETIADDAVVLVAIRCGYHRLQRSILFTIELIPPMHFMIKLFKFAHSLLLKSKIEHTHIHVCIWAVAYVCSYAQFLIASSHCTSFPLQHPTDQTLQLPFAGGARGCVETFRAWGKFLFFSHRI